MNGTFGTEPVRWWCSDAALAPGADVTDADLDRLSALVGYRVYIDPFDVSACVRIGSSGWSFRLPNGGRHSRLPQYRRAVALVAFQGPERSAGSGGELYLADALGNTAKAFEPRPGRLIAFECANVGFGFTPVAPGAPELHVEACYLLTPTRTEAAPEAARCEHGEPKVLVV